MTIFGLVILSQCGYNLLNCSLVAEPEGRMVITFDKRRHGFFPDERDTKRLADEFFRNWPKRRPASELEVLLLSEALGCGEGLMRYHLAVPAVKIPRRPAIRPFSPAESERTNAAGWRSIRGSRGARDLVYWPQLHRLLESSEALRRSSARVVERALRLRSLMDALISHSDRIRSHSRMQIQKADALLEEARLAVAL